MGRKCNDVYGEEKVYYYPGAIVRVRRPILTEEERAVMYRALSAVSERLAQMGETKTNEAALRAEERK